MMETASKQARNSRRGLTGLLVLLLSLFAASPFTTASAASSQTNAVVTDAEPRSNSSVSDASKRVKLADLLALLDSGPKVLTRLVYVRPAGAPGTALISQAAATLRIEYNARAPPASLI